MSCPRSSIFFSRSSHHPDLHSFPTRRSSDLDAVHHLLPSGIHVRVRGALLRWKDNAAWRQSGAFFDRRSRAEEHTSELQSLDHLVCHLLLEKKKPHTEWSAVRAQRALPPAAR